MVWKRKSVLKQKVGILAALICAFIMLFGVLAGFQINKKEAGAQTTYTSVVSEICDTSGTTAKFNAVNTYTLYSYLTGDEDATYATVESYASTARTATDLANNGSRINAAAGTGIVLTFGGLDWTATYLSKDQNNHVILTLWLANNLGTTQFNTSFSKSAGSATTYAANTYGISYFRSVALNMGEAHYNGSTTVLAPAPGKQAGNAFAKFTMPSLDGNVVDYLVTPSNVPWQMAETTNKNDPAYTGAPSGYYGYHNWENDPIWLPSTTETGYTKKAGCTLGTPAGLWVTTTEQKKTSDGGWLRSGDSADHHGQACMYSGGNVDDPEVRVTLGIRPALHLDLTAVDNSLNVKVKYVNLTKSGGTETETSLVATGADADGWHIISKRVGSTEEIATAPDGNKIPANHTFVGWTTDKTDPTKIVTSKSQINGEVTLYAVWGASAVSATISGAGTMTYGDTTPLTLKANISVSGMKNPQVTYTWRKQGETAMISNAQTYSPKTVPDSGTYECEYAVYDANEPLWRVSGRCTNTADVTVNPAPVRMRAGSFKLTAPDEAYYGKKLEFINFTVIMEDSKGNEVAGPAATWKAPALKAIKGTNNADFVFTPTDNVNYKAEAKYPVSFESTFLPLVFDMTASLGETLTVELEYENNNSAAYIVNQFETEFAKLLTNDPTLETATAGYTPCFDGVEIHTYLSTSGGINGVTTKQTIYITFIDQKYNVTVQYNDDTTPEDTLQYGYGIRIKSEDLPDPTREGYVFQGWYVVDDKDAMTNEKWDVNTSRVMGETKLRAKWFKQVLTLKGVEIGLKGDGYKYTATEALKDGDITVWAVYDTTDAEGNPDTVKKELPFGDYTIAYDGGNSAPYMASPGITVAYDNGTKRVTATATLPLEAKRLTVDPLYFSSKSYQFDDKVHKIPEIPTDVYSTYKISSVEYVYKLDGETVENPKAIGIYSVTATVTTTSANYVIDPITVQMEIYKGKTAITIQWDTNTFVYNGSGQHPTAKLYLSNGAELDSLTIKYIVRGTGLVDGEAVNVGTAYTVEASIESNQYVIEDGSDALKKSTLTFSITKATVAAPTLNGELTYNGDEQLVKNILLGYDEKLMQMTQDKSATNAGKYVVNISLRSSANTQWSNASGTVRINWEIKKATLQPNWNGYAFYLNSGSDLAPRVESITGAATADASHINANLDTILVYSGDTAPTEVGSYTIKTALNDPDLSKNYVLDPTASEWEYVVVPNDSVTVVDIEWSATEFEFNGKVQAPTATVKDMDGNPVDIKVTYEGDHKISKWENEDGYTVKAIVPEGYFIKSGANCKYTIVANDDGKGGLDDEENPNNPDKKGDQTTPGGDGSGGGDHNGNGGGSGMPENFPLWQLLTSIGSAILIAVFAAMWAKFDGRKKKAKKDTDKYNKTAVAGMLPVFSTTAVLFGWSNMAWSIIAFCFIGVVVFVLIGMLIARKNCLAAEAACEEAFEDMTRREKEARAEREEAERRRQEEKEEKEQRRMEEERRKRDEDMKMMLMMMRGGNGGNGGEESYNYVPYNNPMDVGAVVSQVISGLLPSIQGMLPPPAPSHDEELVALREEIRELRNDREPQVTVVDNSEELAALREQIQNLQEGLKAPAPQVVEHVVVKKVAEEDEDDEDWTDDDEEDFYEEVSEEGDLLAEVAPAEQRARLPLNFRVRLKASSEKNHNAYVEIKNLLNSYKGISFRMSGRTEKVKYQGEVIAIIGVARKSLKLWLALNPFAYDEKRYHQKDASEKVSYAQTPMLVRVGSERALKRVSELIAELMAKFSVEQRKKYTDKDLQVLAYTLKRNALLKAKKTDLLRGSIHVHDTDVLTNEEALEYLEQKERGAIGKENFATVSLDTLEENFFDGQKVTLDKLKKKGLVAEECNGYRVTAGERLTKPLFVVADEFSTSAVKMLILTGGRAVQLFDPFAKK